MVTSTKGRTLSSRAGARRAAVRRSSLRDRVVALIQQGIAGIPDLAGTPRLRRELLGIGLVLIALLTAWVLGRGGDDGRLVDWWGRTIRVCTAKRHRWCRS